MNSKKYDVSSVKQLIDLNGETTNFDLTFTATSDDDEPFDILIVDQDILDNNKNLEYKHANGTISGNLVSDKNIYKNYYLILKSDKPCKVTVTIDKTEIEPVEPEETFNQKSPVSLEQFSTDKMLMIGGSIIIIIIMILFLKNDGGNGGRFRF